MDIGRQNPPYLEDKEMTLKYQMGIETKIVQFPQVIR